MLILVGHVYPYIHPIVSITPLYYTSLEDWYLIWNPQELSRIRYHRDSMGMDPIGKEVQVVPLGINL